MTAVHHQTVSLPLRPELVGRTPYGAPQIAVPVRLNTNENPFAPAAAVRADIERRVTAQLNTANRYPDRDAVDLRTALAGYITVTTKVAVTAEQVWAANGSNEVLQQLLQAFAGPGRTALGFEPTYSMHHMISQSTGTAYRAEPRSADMTIDLDRAVVAIEAERPDLVFVCTPNNPTGTSTPLEQLAAIYDATDGIVVVDEAYAEFSSSASCVCLLDGRPRLVVSRTMSKAFGLAAVRVGYLIAHPDVVAAMKLVRLPYHLSSLTQHAALGALAHHVELLEKVELLRRERDRVVGEIESLGLSVYPSESNFVLFCGLKDAPRTWRELIDRGVLVRDVEIPGSLRVSIGTPAENDRFLHALEEIA